MLAVGKETQAANSPLWTQRCFTLRVIEIFVKAARGMQ